MAAETEISWADSTVNLWEGCTRVSAACDHCYAEKRNARYAPKGINDAPNWGPHAPRRRVAAGWILARKFQRAANDNGGVDPELGRRRRVFVNSLSDFFDNHDSVVWRDEAWDLIRSCPDIIFMLLTKRPQNIAKMLPPDWGDGWDNVWIGVTVENQEEARRRIPILCATPAALRFLSMEPLLEAVSVVRLDRRTTSRKQLLESFEPFAGKVYRYSQARGWDFARYTGKIGWVIVGGESGGEARPMHPEWVNLLLAECRDHGIPFHFKQWGAWVPLASNDGGYWPTDRGGCIRLDFSGERRDTGWPMQRVTKQQAGHLLEGRAVQEFPIDERKAA